MPTVQEGITAVRQARRLRFLGYHPVWRWTIKSTDGTYTHELVYDEALEDIRCLTCEKRHSWTHPNAWCRQRVIKWMEVRAKSGKVSQVRKGVAQW